VLRQHCTNVNKKKAMRTIELGSRMATAETDAELLPIQSIGRIDTRLIPLLFKIAVPVE
jgi:hypothetical protein